MHPTCIYSLRCSVKTRKPRYEFDAPADQLHGGSAPDESRARGKTLSPQFSRVLPSPPIPHWQPQMGRCPLRRKRRRQRHRSPNLRGVHRRKRLLDVTSNLIKSHVRERAFRTWALLWRQPEAPCRGESSWHRHQIGEMLVAVPAVEFCFLAITRLREDDVEPLQGIIWLGQFYSSSRIEARDARFFWNATDRLPVPSGRRIQVITAKCGSPVDP